MRFLNFHLEALELDAKALDVSIDLCDPGTGLLCIRHNVVVKVGVHGINFVVQGFVVVSIVVGENAQSLQDILHNGMVLFELFDLTAPFKEIPSPQRF